MSDALIAVVSMAAAIALVILALRGNVGLARRTAAALSETPVATAGWLRAVVTGTYRGVPFGIREPSSSSRRGGYYVTYALARAQRSRFLLDRETAFVSGRNIFRAVEPSPYADLRLAVEQGTAVDQVILSQCALQLSGNDGAAAVAVIGGNDARLGALSLPSGVHGPHDVVALVRAHRPEDNVRKADLDFLVAIASALFVQTAPTNPAPPARSRLAVFVQHLLTVLGLLLTILVSVALLVFIAYRLNR
jgi:hypothetical protein